MLMTRFKGYIIIAGKGFALAIGGDDQISVMQDLPQILQELEAKKEELDDQQG